jgi:hypothetical protein
MDDEPVWRTCRFIRKAKCHECPAEEISPNYGPGTRMCRMRAEDQLERIELATKVLPFPPK